MGSLKLIYFPGGIRMSAELVYAVTNVLLYVFWCLSVSFVCERRFSFPLSLLLHFIGGILFFLLFGFVTIVLRGISAPDPLPPPGQRSF